MSRFVCVFAHTDDDLFFFNPYLCNQIRAGKKVTSIVLTTANLTFGEGYWLKREQGLRDAYSYMGDLPKWTQKSVIFPSLSKTLTKFVAGNVSIIFLRLPGGSMGGVDNLALKHLWTSQKKTVSTVDEANIYDRNTLTELLLRLLKSLQPYDLAMPDPVIYGYDHPDHHYAAVFILAALIGTGIPVKMFRCSYSIKNLPVNLTKEEQAMKTRALDIYRAQDIHAIPNVSFMSRQYFREAVV